MLEKIKRAAAADPVTKKLGSQMVTGFPNDKCNLGLDIRPYRNVKERLAIDQSDDMIVIGPRVVIPQSVHADILRDFCTKLCLILNRHSFRRRRRNRSSRYRSS